MNVHSSCPRVHGVSLFRVQADETNLRVLDLSRNRLTGGIPGLCRRRPFLESIRLFGNMLTGRIPDCTGASLVSTLCGFCLCSALSLRVRVGNCTNLIELNLAANQLTGPIPSTICALKQLQVLRLAANGLTGGLPCDDICEALVHLEVFSVPGNQLNFKLSNLLAVSRVVTQSSAPSMLCLTVCLCFYVYVHRRQLPHDTAPR